MGVKLYPVAMSTSVTSSAPRPDVAISSLKRTWYTRSPVPIVAPSANELSTTVGLVASESNVAVNASSGKPEMLVNAPPTIATWYSASPWLVPAIENSSVLASIIWTDVAGTPSTVRSVASILVSSSDCEKSTR